MSKYTIVIDNDGFPDDELGLQQVTSEHNATLAEGEVPLTQEEYLTRVLTIAAKSYGQHFLQTKTKTLFEKFEKADPVTRAAVEDVLK